MRSNKMVSIFLTAISLITNLLFFAGCGGENPVSPEETHFNAKGILFLREGNKIAEILNGITADTLFASFGNLTEHVEVKFIDEHKNIIDPPNYVTDATGSLDDDHSNGHDNHHPGQHGTNGITQEGTYLDWVIDDAEIFEVYQHGEKGGYAFHLRGFKNGSTKVEFFVKHEDHLLFRSGKITVIVE
ncbi:MAG: hypothetical protein A2068_12000 [Ignavibacteria bacterium GWB2_35_6b]|nr:MAG: hypothetical protein A2068_12000 [Ignavibacteria bacterium GWB2_35_6b]